MPFVAGEGITSSLSWKLEPVFFFQYFRTVKISPPAIVRPEPGAPLDHPGGHVEKGLKGMTRVGRKGLVLHPREFGLSA